MRPTATDTTLSPRNVLATVRRLEAAGYLIQPKLNGDRVLLVKRGWIVEAYNRRGSRYGFSVHAISDWRALPEGTLLDGEGWQGRFYPFEALEIGGD